MTSFFIRPLGVLKFMVVQPDHFNNSYTELQLQIPPHESELNK